MSETSSLPKRPSKDTNKFYKKTMQNFSELASSRRLPTACFGLVRKQETESYATQVVDSHPEFGVRGAQATRETKRKLNPFVKECEASATQETLSKGSMRSERMRGLNLSKPVSLEQFVTLMMSPLGVSRSLSFNKTDIHPATTSSNSESCKSHVPMCNHLPPEVSKCTHGWPDECTVRPDKSGEALF